MRPIVILGDVHIDAVFDASASVQNEGKQFHFTIDSPPPDCNIYLGGAGANTAVAAAALGAPTYLCAAISGDDAGGKMLSDMLSDRQVHTDYLTPKSGNTMCVVAFTAPDGERILKAVNGIEDPVDDKLCIGDLPTSLPEDFIFYTTGIQLLQEPMRSTNLHFMQWCRQNDHPVVFDFNLRVEAFGFSGQNRIDMQTACDLADVILGSAKDEICFFTGIDDDFSAAKSLQKGNNTVICKLGGQGCAVFTKDIALLQPAADVTVADTLGAGDTFSGGLLAGLSRGLELDNCLRMATAAAGYSVQFTGAGTVGDINTLQPIINTLAPCELI